MFSIVIVSYNRAHYLGNCLNSLERQYCNKNFYEVIVINDGSTDTTKELLENFRTTTQLQFSSYHFENAGVSAARNRGVSLAKYDIVAFTDDDCILPPDWLDRLIKSWENAGDSIAGIGGSLNTVTLGIPTFTSRFIHYLDEFNYIPVLKNWYIKPFHVSCLTGCEIIPYLRTSNASFRKKYLEQVEGFDESFKQPGGEDPDICYRLMKCGYSLFFDVGLVVDHLSRVSLAAYFKSLRNYVVGDFRKSAKRGQYPAEIARCYRFMMSRKLVSSMVCFVKLPLELLKLVLSSNNYSLLFPMIICVAKLYVVSVSLKYSLLIKRDVVDGYKL